MLSTKKPFNELPVTLETSFSMMLGVHFGLHTGWNFGAVINSAAIKKNSTILSDAGAGESGGIVEVEFTLT